MCAALLFSETTRESGVLASNVVMNLVSGNNQRFWWARASMAESVRKQSFNNTALDSRLSTLASIGIGSLFASL